MIYFNVVFQELVNSDIEALRFEETRTTKYFLRGPGPLEPEIFYRRKLQDPSKNENFVLVPSKLSASMSEFTKSRRTTLKSII